ncbi:MAG: amino acid ABC transporter permease, partial [Parasporobacterium sp.]|nr:amino acid ABC transporter permease [Parasporobacterium sp.]
MTERIWGILVEGFGKILLAGIQVTIPLTVIGISLAMVIAMFMAMVQYAKIPVLRQISRFYIWIFRGTPLLVQLFLAYYGLPKIGIVMDAFPCAVMVFALNEGAYCSETMRSAFEAVPPGQLEAGYCVGMNYLQVMWHVVIPQALRTAFPPLSNSLIAMLKDTSLVASITVADMFMAAQKIVGRTYEPLWVYSEVALIYLIFSTILTFIQRKME